MSDSTWHPGNVENACVSLTVVGLALAISVVIHGCQNLEATKVRTEPERLKAANDGMSRDVRAGAGFASGPTRSACASE